MYCFVRCYPSRVEQLGKVDQSQALLRAAATSKVEDDGRLHRREEGVTGASGAMVEEVGLVNTPVL